MPKKKSSPPGPQARLGIRNLARFIGEPLSFLTECRERFGDVVTIALPTIEFTMLSDPDDIERMFLDRDEGLKKDKYIENLKWVLGEGLLTSEGAFWRRQRQLSAHAFTPRRIKGYGSTIVDAAERMTRGFEDGEVIDVHREMFRVTLDIVAKTLFDADVAGAAGRVGEAMEHITEYFASSPEMILGVPRWVPTPTHIAFERAPSSS